MAKCIGTVNELLSNWNDSYDELEVPESDSSVNKLLEDEEEINTRLKDSENLIYTCGSLFSRIRQNAYGIIDRDAEKTNCSKKVQQNLIRTLKDLEISVVSTISELIVLFRRDKENEKSDAIQNTYLTFINGISEQLHNMVNMAGRLNDLNSCVYTEDRYRLLMSNSSIAIHCLTSIWLQAVKLSNMLKNPIKLIFNDLIKSFKSEDFNGSQDEEFEEMLFEQLGVAQCFSIGTQNAKILIMDLIITSWVKYKRLMKHEDLLKGSPFLCLCHNRLFKKLLVTFLKEPKSRLLQYESTLLANLLVHVITYDKKPSYIVGDSRHYSIIPPNPIYKEESEPDRAFFILWHLYSLSKLVSQDSNTKESGMDQIKGCHNLLENCFQITIRQFVPILTSGEPKAVQPDPVASTSRTPMLTINDANLTLEPVNKPMSTLSPHNQERLKLLFMMLYHWLDKVTSSSSLIYSLFYYLENNWDLLGKEYFKSEGFKKDLISTHFGTQTANSNTF